MVSPYRVIGRGTFGVAFVSADDPETAVKKTFKGSETLALEYQHGLATNFAVTTTGPWLQQSFPEPVPCVPWYQSTHGMKKPSAKDPWWVLNHARFPSSNGDGVPDGVFLFERIPPVPRSLQESIIRRFWPESRQQAALDDPENRDCMIRPYLQERWAYHESRGRKRLNNEQKESLRNFPAYLDDLEAMGIDCHAVARQIALGLAVAHWEAQHDLTDSEFYIAGQRSSPKTAARSHTAPLEVYHAMELRQNCTIFSDEPSESPKTHHGLPLGTQMWARRL